MVKFASYAQCFEDVILYNVFENEGNGFYIDVGANDPEKLSVTKALYDRGFSGINIEPLLSKFIKLEYARPRDINLCMGVGDKEETLDFYEFDDMSTFNLNAYEGVATKPKRKVNVVPLSKICEEYCPNHQTIHFLKIDVEGFEKEVLKGMDFSQYRPRVLVIEAADPGTTTFSHEKWESILFENGYDLAFAYSINRYYVDKNFAEIKSQFLPIAELRKKYDICFPKEACEERSYLKIGNRTPIGLLLITLLRCIIFLPQASFNSLKASYEASRSNGLDHYPFGENWKNYIKNHFSEKRAAIASEKLLASLMLENLHGMSFLDIGCGSGLHSLGAYRAGASKVFSFDYDQNSVDTTKMLWEMEGKPENWHIMQGSVLDTPFMKSLGVYDIVYSWGVLHHTGSMYDAIRNACIPLDKNGVFFIALYSDAKYRDTSLLKKSPTPEEWIEIKKNYNSASPWQKRIMEYRYVWDMYFSNVFPNPRRLWKSWKYFSKIKKDYIDSRGMEYWTDVRDWLGGWPMEFVNEQELLTMAKKELDLYPIRINTAEGNTEFVFRSTAATNYLDAVVASWDLQPVSSTPLHETGFMYKINLLLPDGKSVLLFENGMQLAYNNAEKKGIETFGEGRYLYHDSTLYFASSDNSDPRINGYTYSYTFV